MPDSVFRLIAGDRFPSIAYALIDGLGASVDLTGAAAVRFQMGKRGKPPKVNATATVTDAEAGEVTYSWLTADTDEPGAFDACWEVDWSAGNTETFPSIRGEFQVVIDPEIA